MRIGVVRLPARLGRYRIVSLLGEGGMSDVYRAIDPQTGEAVAIKAVSGGRAVNLACLRREVHALSRLSHPGIVRIRDHGIDDGVPWYAMDLVAGTSLRRLLSGDGDVGVTRTAGAAVAFARPRRPVTDLRRVLGVLHRLCGPLSYLHAEGIVHRDLKPENIVVGYDDKPVIVDFGIAAQLTGAGSREAVAGEPTPEVGTFGYMAPEQRRGEAHDARADIYALGCMLYEALTGQLPMTEHPAPPRALVPGVAPALDELAMRLLSADARDRIGYVDDVGKALASILEIAAAPQPRQRTYVYRPTLVGREQPMRAVFAWLDGTHGGIALVRGESGSGKTRFVMEVARRLARDGVRVIAGECAPPDVDGLKALALSPLAPLLRAIADYCRGNGRDATERILGRRLGVLAAYEPALRALVPEGDAEPAPLAPQAARARLYADLAITIGLFAREAPFVLMVDDIQWMDELTSTFLAANVEHLREAGIRILATFRREAALAPIEKLIAASDVVIDIGRLDSAAVARMLSDMLAIASPPDALVRFMHDHSEGNPFFVAEYVRAAVQEGWLARDRDGKWKVIGAREANDALPLPASIRELMTQRLGAITPTAQQFIAAAAVLGREVAPDIVAEIIEIDPEVELRVTEELIRREVLTDTRGAHLSFSHDKLRELAYERLEVTERSRLHGRAARSLERLHGDNEPTSGTLAYHFREAGEVARAVDYFEKAGEHALRTAAHGQARAFFGQALTLAHDVAAMRRARWMRRAAEAAFGLGDIAASEAQAHATLAQLTDGLPESKAGWLSMIAQGVAKQVVGWAVPRARVSSSEPERVRSLEAALAAGQLASTYYFTGDGLRMVATLLAGVNLADRAGSPAAVVESHARLGYIAGVGGIHWAARHYFGRASMLTRREASGRALVLYLHAFYHLGLAEWTAADEKGTRAVTLLIANGDRQDAEIAQTIAAHAVYYAGQIAEARGRFEHVLASAKMRGNTQHEAWGHYLIARSDLAQGDVAAAIERLEHAHRLLAPIADRFSAVMCDGLRAEAYLARSDLAAAAAMANQLDRMLTGPVVPLAPCVHGYVGRARVRLALAADAYGESRKLGAARSACRDLARFARVFPMARAASLRLDAALHLLDGDQARPVRRLRESIAAARRYRMPYDEALAQLELARLEPRRDRADRHRDAASALLARIGARAS